VTEATLAQAALLRLAIAAAHRANGCAALASRWAREAEELTAAVPTETDEKREFIIYR
jgi:hypothetical protein